jgi:hypothetical protein
MANAILYTTPHASTVVTEGEFAPHQFWTSNFAFATDGKNRDEMAARPKAALNPFWRRISSPLLIHKENGLR